MGKIKVLAFQCERCDHVWVPRMKTREPRVCPKCKSPYWDVPRKNMSKVGEREKTKATRD